MPIGATSPKSEFEAVAPLRISVSGSECVVPSAWCAKTGPAMAFVDCLGCFGAPAARRAQVQNEGVTISAAEIGGSSGLSLDCWPT